MGEMSPRLQAMYEADVALDAAITQSVAADVSHPPEIVGWVAMAAHQLPDGEVAVWWASGDLSDEQLASLAGSLVDEIEGVVPDD
jgi:hypothetical protein